MEISPIDRANEVSTLPPTELQQLGDIVAQHEVPLLNEMPEQLRAAYGLLMHNGSDYEATRVGLGLESTEQVSALETELVSRALRRLVRISHTLPGLKEALGPWRAQLRPKEPVPVAESARTRTTPRVRSKTPRTRRLQFSKKPTVSRTQNDVKPAIPRTPLVRRVDPGMAEKWKNGELRNVLRGAKVVLENREIDPQILLKSRPRWQAALPLLTDPELPPGKLQEQLGIKTTREASRMTRSILELLVAVTSADVLNIKSLRQTAGRSKSLATVTILPPNYNKPSRTEIVPQAEEIEWRRGEARGVIKKIGALLLDYNIDVSEILDSQLLQQAYELLVDTELTLNQISERLGLTAQISHMPQRILQEFINYIPPEMLRLDELRQQVVAELPKPNTVPSPLQDSVGQKIDALMEKKHPTDKTIGVGQLAKHCEKSESAIWRFLRGSSMVSPAEFTVILDYLQLSDEDVTVFKAAFKEERLARRKRTS